MEYSQMALNLMLIHLKYGTRKKVTPSKYLCLADWLNGEFLLFLLPLLVLDVRGAAVLLLAGGMFQDGGAHVTT